MKRTVVSILQPAENSPPGRTRIMESLSKLLTVKEFNRITTAEIARTAEVTEGLIYKYFKDKHDLLYQVLALLFSEVIETIEERLSEASSPVSKLEVFVTSSIECYAQSRVFSKILLLEVRNSQKFFASDAYQLVRRYSGLLKSILQEGIESGQFNTTLDVTIQSEIIFGAIEHSCLTAIIFNRELDTEMVARQLCQTMFHGMVNTPPTNRK